MQIRKFVITIATKFDPKGFQQAEKATKSLSESADRATKSFKALVAAELEAAKGALGLAHDAGAAQARIDKLEKSISKLRKRLDELNRRSLKNVGASLKGASEKLDKFRSAMAPIGQIAQSAGRGLLALGGGAVATAGLVIKTGASFESLRARLKTVTGSTEAAAGAFALIKDFAKTTPFQVEDVTTAFVRLKSLGLDASKESLTSFGNLAAAQGKSIIDFIEAVADASTGEFERLKEFGIKASSQGDQVAFTFKGTTTTVGKNAEEIQAFLKGLGETEFAGAMADQMTTTSGAISNLKDTFSNFLDQVAQMGVLDEFKLLLSDLSGLAGGDGFAGVLAETLVNGIKAVREWIGRLTEEDIRGFIESAAAALKGLVSAFELAAKAMEVFSNLSGDTEATLGNLALALTAVIALFAGPAGLVVAAGAAGAVIGRMLANLALELDGTNDALDRLDGRITVLQGNIAKHEREIAAAEGRIAKRDQDAEARQKAREKRGAERVQALVGGAGAGLVRDLSPEDKAFAAQVITKTGDTSERAAARDRLLTGTGQQVLEAVDKTSESLVREAEQTARQEAQRAGANASEIESAAANARLAAQRDTFSRREKAFKAATEAFAQTGSTEAAVEAATSASLSKRAQKEKKAREKKKGGKGTQFFDFEKKAGAAAKTQGEAFAEQELQRLVQEGAQADQAIKQAQEAGKARAAELKQRFLEAGRIFDASANNILDVLGLRGPGSVLEGRPPPQTLLITIAPVFKLIDTFNQTIGEVSGAKALAEVTGQGGQAAIEQGLTPNMKQLEAAFKMMLSLQLEGLLKATGGGTLPKGPEG